MGKNSIKRRNTSLRTNEAEGMVSEEHFVFDNNLMPTAEELLKYQEIDPKFVEYFMKITDEERLLRHELSRRTIELVEKNSARQYRGMIIGMGFALIALLVLLAIVWWALYTDKPWIAGVFGAFSVVGIVSAFINGNRMNEKNKEE